MGLIDKALGAVFGSGGNIMVETAEVFRENAENRAQREAQAQSHALAQFAAEFAQRDRGRFDRFIDGVNRLPRPAMALGTLGLFLTAMVSPVWFTSRMEGLAYVPEPLWWLLGAVVSFYFGARHQAKGQEFRRSVMGTLAAANIHPPRERSAPRTVESAQTTDVVDTSANETTGNPALDEWRASR